MGHRRNGKGEKMKGEEQKERRRGKNEFCKVSLINSDPTLKPW